MGKSLLAYIVALGLMLFAVPAAIANGVIFPGVSHEFGSVTQGEKVIHVFPFRNETGRPIEIERMQSSAVGMRVGIKRLIAPGEEGIIRLEWDTSKVKGKATADVTVYFADATLSPVTLLLQGTVKPTLEMRPYNAVFFSLFKGETAERVVTIVNNHDKPLNITRVEPAGSHFSAAIESVTPGKIHRLRVTVPADVTAGRYREAVYLYTDHPVNAKLKVGVNVLVKNDLYVIPEKMELGRVDLESLANNSELQKLLTRIFMVKKRQGDFEIRSIVSNVPGLQITQFPPQGKSGAFRIDVALDWKDLKPGLLQGDLRIKTDDTAFPVLVVPIRVDLQ